MGLTARIKKCFLMSFVFIPVLYASPVAAHDAAVAPYAGPLGYEDAEKQNEPWLGVMGADVDEETAGTAGLKNTKGVLVLDVVPGSPAEQAGIVAGDIILKAGGADIAGFDDFTSMLRNFKIGSKIGLLVSKEGAVKDVFITLAQRPKTVPGRLCASGDGYAQGGTGYCGAPDSTQLYQNYTESYTDIIRELKLTKDQLKKARAVLDDYEKRDVRIEGDMDVWEVELREMLGAAPVNISKIKSKIEAIGAKDSELRFLRIKTFEDFKKILTDEQRKALEDVLPPGEGDAERSGYQQNCTPQSE